MRLNVIHNIFVVKSFRVTLKQINDYQTAKIYKRTKRTSAVSEAQKRFSRREVGLEKLVCFRDDSSSANPNHSNDKGKTGYFNGTTS